MNLTWKRASELSVDQLLQVWNQSFEGYFVDMTMTASQLEARFVRDQISLDHSIVGYANSEPVGLVLNALQMIKSQKISWNGGTAVMPKYRNQKLGHLFMERVLEIYQEQGVQTAYLEAFAENAPAIRLYEKMGYQAIDRLCFYSLRTEGSWAGSIRGLPDWMVRSVSPEEVSKLSFYQHFAPWQTQWDHIPEAKGMILEHPEYGPISYALYRLTREEEKAQTVVTLYQVGFATEFQMNPEANEQLIHHLFATHQDAFLLYTTVNLSMKNQVFLHMLEQYGFEKSIEQVFMKKDFLGTN
ncbi:ribosomal protein S18 acetylase RimI-like enzyme [Croceifilum oryzae]|uniref:Ribosomal protein S18 acetylase RimI-like enzyme n=1 Tax=Croceifilum oryzae TaxID=1553429 RepID=A0AAJ1TG35_9BACL|nr:GNAT family N-acetyltransferase [Croceifilum oryzae]MDQ0415907.1 ribosomal protein S18 acetylase RimI-like enzyme [Croceifilum oryzae]